MGHLPRLVGRLPDEFLLHFQEYTSMTNEEIFYKIKEFTVEQAGKGAYEITENSALETDLDIYGDDAIEYIIDFGKVFEVDVSKFMSADYFSGEGEFKLLPFFVDLFRIMKKPREKELSIRHLILAVRTGRLDDEIINSSRHHKPSQRR